MWVSPFASAFEAHFLLQIIPAIQKWVKLPVFSSILQSSPWNLQRSQEGEQRQNGEGWQILGRVQTKINESWKLNFLCQTANKKRLAVPETDPQIGKMSSPPGGLLAVGAKQRRSVCPESTGFGRMVSIPIGWAAR